jgi:hypothetical protein
MVLTEFPARNMAIAAPLHKEWRPISWGWKPRRRCPRVWEAERTLLMRKEQVRDEMRPLAKWMVLTVDVFVVDG